LSIFSVTVERLCRVRSGAVGDELPFPLDPDGFLDLEAAGPTGATDDDPAGRLLPLRDALRAGAVVLLGEPGLGKSTEFKALHDYCDALGLIVEVDGAEITDTASFDELVGRHLRTLPQRLTAQEDSVSFGGGSVGAQPQVVIIDQVDESPIRRQLAGRLRLALHDRDTSTLGLVLGCRTADYPPNLTSVLTNIFGACIIADLAPLTRVEATALASSAVGIDGDALISAAVECGAGVLANVPLTLELLVRTFRQHEGLGAAPDELFARGVLQLVDEHDEERAIVDDESTSDQRLAIAARIAARLMLSGRRTIWRGPALDSGEDDVTADLLVGGEEQTDGHAFDVTKRMVAATLATGLFTGRGANRLAFRHGSFAAFLAARYLVRRNVPTAQLHALFLAAGGGTARVIPTSLRETAAWLLNADDTNALWLVEADPESLVPHSPLVDSAATRKLLVEAMLLRAAEFEAGNHAWARVSRHLKHPDLDTQLSAVLSQAAAGRPADWDSAARIRLAVRLAREANSAAVADDLLRIVEHDQWDASTRALAALTSFEISPGSSTERLASVLARLADREHASVVDPYYELAGTLLSTLWPASLPTAEVLPFLGRPGSTRFVGTYRLFRHTFVEQLTEADMNVVLGWAAEALEPDGRQRVSGSAPEPDVPDGGSLHVAASLGDLFDEVVERALSMSEANGHLDAVAAILHRRFQRHDQPAIPRPVDLVTADEAEPETVRSLRRALATALIARMVAVEPFDGAAAWHLVGSWSNNRPLRYGKEASDSSDGLRRGSRGALLGSEDFPWLYGLSAQADSAGHADLAEAYAICAAWVFDLAHEESGSLAFSNQSHPAWRHIAWWFEPMPVDSDAARNWRKLHADDGDEAAVSPEDLTEFHQVVQRLFSNTIAGESDAFWRLADALQFDPDTATGSQRFDDDLLQYPGVPLLSDDAAEQLADAAMSYVIAEHDHADEWLEQNLHDKRAWAGYLALALLQRRDRLGRVPPERWGFWVGAIVDFHAVPAGAGDADVKRLLLARVIQYAPQQLADAVKLYVRTELTSGNFASEVELIDPGTAQPLADAWLELVTVLHQAITAAEDASLALESDQAQTNAASRWEQMLAALLAVPDPRAVDLAVRNLTATGDGIVRVLAGRAGNLLLRSDPPRHLPTILQTAQADPAIGREIALAIARFHSARSPLADLALADLVLVYRWLSSVFPPEEDPGWRPGAHFVGPEEQAREWRDRTLEAIVDIGTAEAVEALAQLRDEYPEHPALLYSFLRCRAVAARDGWVAPSPAEITQLLDDAQRRFSRSEPELREALLEILDAIAADLAGHGDLLWDRIPKRLMPDGQKVGDGWCPKLEYALQAYLTHELTIRVARRGIIVNREVMVRPTDAATGAGDRADILVETASRLTSINGPTADRVAVVIEVKGPWNKDLLTSQRTQLAERYLPASKTGTGVYLVGWYPLEQWTPADYKRVRAAHYTRAGLFAELSEQAAAIHNELGMSTDPYVLEVPLPHREMPDDEPTDSD